MILKLKETQRYSGNDGRIGSVLFNSYIYFFSLKLEWEVLYL